MLNCKWWVGIQCVGVCVFTFSPAQAMTAVDVHARNLGPVAPTALAAHLHLQAGNKLVATHTTHLRNGKNLTRIRQVYKGVPVYGRSVVVTRDARNNVLKVVGQLEHNLGTELASIQPRLNSAQAQCALQKALGQLRQPTREGKAILYVFTQPTCGALGL